jgi:hypothetical protein
MDAVFRYIYLFTFSDGSKKSFDLRLDPTDLRLVMKRPENLPLWAMLSYEKCEICPLDSQQHTYCPIAANLAVVVEEFRNFLSHERVNVTVLSEDRAYGKDTTVQGGLSPMHHDHQRLPGHGATQTHGAVPSALCFA